MTHHPWISIICCYSDFLKELSPIFQLSWGMWSRQCWLTLCVADIFGLDWVPLCRSYAVVVGRTFSPCCALFYILQTKLPLKKRIPVFVRLYFTDDTSPINTQCTVIELHTIISDTSTSSYLCFLVGVAILSRMSVFLTSHFTQTLFDTSTYTLVYQAGPSLTLEGERWSSLIDYIHVHTAF